MELLKYDPQEDAATISIATEELNDLVSIVAGLRSTFLSQDPTIFLGIDDARLEYLSISLLAMMDKDGQ